MGLLRRRSEELFELYQKCANRKQIETICTGYLRSLEATKVSVNDALEQAEEKWNNEEYVLDVGDFIGAKFEVKY